MNVFIIYLIGSLLGFGIAYSSYDFAVKNGYKEDLPFDKSNHLFFGALFSWVTVALFIISFFHGLFKRDDDEDGE